MSNGYGRIIGAQVNAMRHSLGSLVGLAQGMLCDGELSDKEIDALKRWCSENQQLCYSWPGDVIYDKVTEVLKDGIVTEEERAQLIEVLRGLAAAPEDDLMGAARVTELAYDDVQSIEFMERRFCFTGEFMHGARPSCEGCVRDRGGLISKGITKELNYLVIGSLGSIEWKHGSFGTKVEKAMLTNPRKFPLPSFVNRYGERRCGKRYESC